jgi:uncharacterized protein YihD (DUF1040 family)
MRDPARIPRLLDAIEAYWRKNPGLSLAQLVCDAAGLDDPFFYEDDDLQQALAWQPNVAEAAVGDSARIGRLRALLERYWLEIGHDDLRLTQIIGRFAERRGHQGPYLLTDDELSAELSADAARRADEWSRSLTDSGAPLE